MRELPALRQKLRLRQVCAPACLGAALLSASPPYALADIAPGPALQGAASIIFTTNVPCEHPIAAAAKTPHHKAVHRPRRRKPVKADVRVVKPNKPVKITVVSHHRSPMHHPVRVHHLRPVSAPPLMNVGSCETLTRDQLANLPQLIAALSVPNLESVAPTQAFDLSDPSLPQMGEDLTVTPTFFSGLGGPIAPFAPSTSAAGGGGGGSSGGGIGPTGGGLPTTPGGLIIPSQPTGSVPPTITGPGGTVGPSAPEGSSPGTPNAPIGVGGTGTGGPTTTSPMVSGVPEPDTWLLLVGGVALVGWRMRRGRSASNPSGYQGRGHSTP